MGFKIKASDGTTLEIQAGDYYFNSKARGRRMMGNSLSSDARRVYACLELATMGFQQELAVTMERGEQRPLTPTDIRNQTGLLKQAVSRGLVELEDAGLALRKAPDGGALRKGSVLLYSWAVPRPPKEENSKRARLPFPEWFPDSWEPARSFISRNKYDLIPDEGLARVYFEEIAAAARVYQEAEIGLARALEPVRAPLQSAGASLYRKNGKNIERKEVSSSAVQVLSPPPKAEEEDATSYQKFKAAYPDGRVDDAKAKPAFEKKTKAEQAHIFERLQVYLACDRWRDRDGQFIPFAGKWLETREYDADPPPVFNPAGPAPAKKGFTDSVLEEAKRRFNNGTL